jgi:uncharacterized membrane protein YeaQ/YmgE (transglycosylase-associated protein family)
MLALSLGGLISWVIFGLIAGIIAKAIMPGKDPGGFIITVLLGIAGAVVGGFIGGAVLGIGDDRGGFGSSGFFTQLIFAVVGAIILLALYRVIAGRRA